MFPFLNDICLSIEKFYNLRIKWTFMVFKSVSDAILHAIGWGNSWIDWPEVRDFWSRVRLVWSMAPSLSDGPNHKVVFSSKTPHQNITTRDNKEKNRLQRMGRNVPNGSISTQDSRVQLRLSTDRPLIVRYLIKYIYY